MLFIEGYFIKIINNTLKNYFRKNVPFIYDVAFRLKNIINLIIFSVKYNGVKVFPKILNGPKYYSQHNQDHIIYNTFFKDKSDGVFVDIGANHPININNTLFFEEKGWSGYAFEPIAAYKELWEKERVANFYNFVVSDVDGNVDFTVVSREGKEFEWVDMLSHVSIPENEMSPHDFNEISVASITLKKFFADNKIKNIDYMSIDVEGHEMNVLKGIDWNMCNISVISIENNVEGYNSLGADSIRKFMKEKGYKFYARVWGLDDIYVQNKFYKGLK